MPENTNLPADAGESALSQPLSIDEAANIDFSDPGEGNLDVEDDQQSEAEPGEAEDSQEAEETEAEADAEDGEEGEPDDESEPQPEPGDDVHVTLNGEKVALSDLKAGYLRQADYSRKTQQVAETRKGLEAMSARVNRSVEAIADFLVKQLPKAPDPNLAMTNPGQFVQQKAMHEAATARITELLEQVGEVKDVESTLTAEQRRDLLEQESAKLAEAFPTTATNEGRAKFFEEASTAAKELGYSDDEIKAVADHRMFKLAHYAMLGLRAEQSKAKAKAKVQDAPPFAPKRQQGVVNAKSQRNKEAMKRLSRTGSIEDALAIDFE